MRKTLAGLAVLTLIAAVMMAMNGDTNLITPAQAGCFPEEKIDGSTAEQARSKFEAVGFRQIHDLHKGCDNYWHAIGTKDGEQSHIVLSPSGDIAREGD